MKKKLVLFILPILLASICLITLSYSAYAVVASDWKAGRIIDDSKFTGLDMSVTDIQNFLNNKVPSCDTWGTQPASEFGRSDITHAQYAASQGWPGPPYVCLKDYHEVPKNSPGPGLPLSSFNNGGNPPAGSISAAQMIYNAAQQYKISPKVLLVKLGTESAGPLTSDRWPLASQYKYAMGAHCPDRGEGGSALCDPNYSGFSIQVAEGAGLLRWYLDSMTQPWWQYKKPYKTNNILWNVEPSGCGGSDVFIESMGTAALYTYTPYQPNQAALNNMYGTGDGCSAYGNRNFWRVYNDWFGPSIMPQIVRNPGGAVFMLSGGYKFYIPSEAILRDFGTDPITVITVSDTYLNNIPWGNSISGQSGNLSYLVKTTSDLDGDGPTLYAVTAGKKYSVVSMEQFTNFRFNADEIAYLPEHLVASIPLAGNLSNFLQSPTNNAFYVNNGQKNIILESQKYLALNPSNKATFSSYFFINRINSGNPLTDKPLLLRYSSGSVAIYGTDKYYPLSSLSTYLCWGLDRGTAGALYQLADDSYAPVSSQLIINSCGVQDVSGNSFLLNRQNKILINGNSNITANSYSDPRIDQVISNLPVQSSQLSTYVKSGSSPGIWKIENNQKRLIPSMQNFNLLKLNIENIQTLDNSVLENMSSGDVVLGKALTVKSPDSPTVYALDASERIAYQSAEQFLAFGNTWGQIETYSTELLNRLFPYNGKNIQSFIINKSTSQVYLIEQSGCYIFDDQMLSRYGKSRQQIDTNQNYSYEVYTKINLNGCNSPSKYIKSVSSPVVYKVENGSKTSFSDWNSLLQDNGGGYPIITVLSNAIINSIN